MKEFFTLFKQSYIQLLDDRKYWTDKPNLEFDKQPFPMTELGKRIDKMKEQNKLGVGVYFTPNPCKGGRKADDVMSIQWVYVEMDNGSKAQQMVRITDAPIMPDMIVESLAGYHCYWKAECTQEEFDEIIQGLIIHFNGDPACKDTSRVFRVPLFYHNKYPNKPFQCKLVRMEIEHHLPSELMEAYPKPIKRWQKEYKMGEDDLHLLRNIPIMDVLNKCGVEVNNKREIVENGEVTSAVVNMKENYVNRFSGKPPCGSTIDVAMYFLNSDVSGAIKWLREEFGIKKPEPVVATITKTVATDEIDKIDQINSNPYTWGTSGADEYIAPIERHHFLVFGGEQQSGKTAFTFHMAVENAKLGHRVMYVSLEMAPDAVVTRIARSYAGITKAQWRQKNTISDTQKNAYKRKKKEISGHENLIVSGIPDEGASTQVIGQLIAEGKPDLVFIDNMDLIEKDPGQGSLENQDRISKFFMDYTNEENIPIVLLHHYKKGDEGKAGVRGLNAFRGSAKITHNADTVVVGFRPNDENMTVDDKAKYIITCVKDREFGEGGTVITYFNKGIFQDDSPTIDIGREVFNS